METFTLDTAIGLNITHAFFFYAESVNAAVWNRARLVEAKLRGCLRDTGVTFAPTRVHSGSLSWLYICFHDTQCHAGASHSDVNSPRLLYQRENFTPVRNFATVSCKAKRQPVSVWNRSAGGLERVAHAQSLRFLIARVFYQHEVYLQITEIWNDPSSCKRRYKIKKPSRYETGAGASFLMFILLHEKLLQFDWLRAVVFQLDLKFLHVKITKPLWQVV